MNKHRGQSIDDFMACPKCGISRGPEVNSDQAGGLMTLAKIAAFGFGSAIGIVVLGELINLGLAIGARKWEEA